VLSAIAGTVTQHTRVIVSGKRPVSGGAASGEGLALEAATRCG